MILRASSSLWTSFAPSIANHLWQSTLFVVLAAILALVLRKNQARVRYWIWLTASLKFLIPLSLLVTFGSHLARPRVSTPAQIVVYSAVENLSQPFAGQELPAIYGAVASGSRVNLLHLLPATVVAVWLAGIVFVVILWMMSWLRVWLIERRAVPLIEGLEVEALRRMESSLGIGKPIRLVLSPNWMEPGIFGIFRPVLIWPEGISRRLDDGHIEAILGHEVCHARRHDNLTAALHMMVEAIFWFHPLAWWVGKKLEDERERACDEEVALLCRQPQVYAESILRVCKFCSESPLACVSGITGADLKERVLQIMTGRVARELTWKKKLLIATLGVCMAAVPILLGQTQVVRKDQAATAENKQWKFGVVSIRRDKTAGPQEIGAATADGYQMKNLFLGYLVMMAYVPQTGGAAYYGPDQVLGMPAWMMGDDDHYDVDAKVDEADLADWQNPAKRPAMLRSMLQSILADRLKLVVHRSTKEASVYLLVVGKNGPKFTQTNPGETHPGAIPIPGGGMLSVEQKDDQETVHYFGISIAQLTSFVLGAAGRPVQDKTGLRGRYDITIQKPAPGAMQPGGPQGGNSAPDPGPSASSIATDLGLKLEPAKGQIETLVIDHVERPSAN